MPPHPPGRHARVGNIRRLVRPVTQRPGPDLQTATKHHNEAVRNPFALRLIPLHAHIRPHQSRGATPGGRLAFVVKGLEVKNADSSAILLGRKRMEISIR